MTLLKRVWKLLLGLLRNLEIRFKIESSLTLLCLCDKSIAILSKLLEEELSKEVKKSDKKLR